MLRCHLGMQTHIYTRCTPFAVAAGHSVSFKLLSNLTSFGVGLSVKSGGGGWQHIPIAYPLRTGLWAVS